MKGIRFELRGETAFFKKPDVNTFMYFTYSQIHKMALLGMLGSIIGLEGYSMQGDKSYPKFFEVLKDLKVAIVPTSQTGDLPGLCSKKVQVFNNSVGYASQEEGGNLIIKEQWLERPSWMIYLLEDGHPYYEKLKAYLLTNRCEFIPYLGKNDHFANIYNVEEIVLEETKECHQIHSLYSETQVDYEEDDYGWDDEAYYKYQEKLPVGLEPTCNQYEIETFVLSNRQLKCKDYKNIYTYNDEHLYFF